MQVGATLILSKYRRSAHPTVGLGGIKVLWYMWYFEILSVNIVKNTAAPLSIKLVWRCFIEVMYCNTHHMPPEVSLYWWNRKLS